MRTVHDLTHLSIEETRAVQFLLTGIANCFARAAMRNTCDFCPVSDETVDGEGDVRCTNCNRVIREATEREILLALLHAIREAGES